jgi:hypothetical protein
MINYLKYLSINECDNIESASMYDTISHAFIKYTTLSLCNFKISEYDQIILSNSINVVSKVGQYKFEKFFLKPEFIWKAFCFARLQVLQFSSKESSM